VKFIRNKLFLPLLGIGSFLVFTLWSFPATIGFTIIAPDKVAGFGVRGSLWNGEAQLININGIKIQQAHWHVNPFRLVVGRIAGNATARWRNGLIEADYSFGLSGDVSIRELQATFNLNQLETQMNVPGISGEASIQIKKLDWVKGWVSQVIGRGEVRNLSATLIPAGTKQALGSYELLFSQTAISDTAPVTGKLRDTGGPLELNGTLVLKPPTAYEFEARIKSRPSATAALTDSIALLPLGTDGARQLILAGSF
jgi:hypothetical protein